MYQNWTIGELSEKVNETEDDDSAIADGYVFAEDRSGLRSDLERLQRGSESSGLRPEIPLPRRMTPPPTIDSQCVQDALRTAETVLMMGQADEEIAQIEENLSIAAVCEGTAMIDTGCSRSIGGPTWHKKVQKKLDSLKIKHWQTKSKGRIQFGGGELKPCLRDWH